MSKRNWALVAATLVSVIYGVTFTVAKDVMPQYVAPFGFIATEAGWTVTEVGRQPFTVYGLLRTADSMSPLAAPAVATSLIAFIVVYFAVFGMGTWYLLRLMSHAPHAHEADLPNAPAHAAGITPGPAMAAAGTPKEPSHG